MLRLAMIAALVVTLTPTALITGSHLAGTPTATVDSSAPPRLPLGQRSAAGDFLTR
jgi:hypothetical protein